MPTEVLDRRALNRALLERQQLLRRVPAGVPHGEAAKLPSRGAAKLPSREAAKGAYREDAEGPREGPRGEDAEAGRVLAVVEHLAGLQAQAPWPPYYGLWSRLDGFRPASLARLLTERRVVRIALMRGTIHRVSARDCLMMRPLVQPVLDRALKATFGRQLKGIDYVGLAAAGRAHVEAAPLTFGELGALLSRRWPDHDPAALAQGVRALVPLVQLPPRAVWGSAGQGEPHLGRGVAGHAAGAAASAGRAGQAVPGRIRPGRGGRRSGLVGPHQAGRSHRRAAAGPAHLSRRQRP